MIVTATLFDLFEMSPERILGNLLKIDVDGGVNAIAFVDCAVPAHCCDDLLTDVIDCVGLPLRVLPAADHDLFRARSRASFPADESQIAHPIEREIARLA